MKSTAAELDSGVESLRLVRVSRPDKSLLESLEAYDRQAFGSLGLRRCDVAVLAEAGRVYLAHLDGNIVGGCQLMRAFDEPDVLHVVGLYILPEWQGRGLGRALLRAVADEARSSGARGLMLTVSPLNQRAMALYGGAGFAEEESLPDFYGQGEDRRLMRWVFDGGDLTGGV